MNDFMSLGFDSSDTEYTPSVTPLFGANDFSSSDFYKLLKILEESPSTPGAKKDDLAKALDNLFGDLEGYKEKGMKQLATGAFLKTVGAASDTFTRLTGILGGQAENIYDAAEIAEQNYENQMTALDNQVLFLKNQLSDRFNKTVETNMINMAAKNLRVNAGNVLELSKETAQDITEDIRMAESNATLKKIALEGAQKATKESARYAEKQMWTGFLSSASKLGLMVTTGGGTGESWGDLYA